MARLFLGLADYVGLHRALHVAGHQGVSGFSAEMRYIYDRRRIICKHRQFGARRKRLQALARFENRQGT